jgi:hypothetical protein
MKKLIPIGILLFIVGCGRKQKTEEANNSATRYVDELQRDVRRAEQATDKANRVIHQQEEESHKAVDQQ